MPLESLLFIAILVLAFFLFSREVLPLEISGLLVLLLLVFTGILEPREALSSFGNEALFLIGSLFVLIAGLNKTGVIKKLETQLLRICGSSRLLSFTLVMVIVAAVSAFVSNTATLAVSIPIIVSMAERFGDSPQKWLMPVAFASVLGGMNTLVGTSTNIIISGLLPEYNVGEFDLFTTSTVGMPILICGLIFLVMFSRYLLPGELGPDENIPLKYGLRPYTAELTVREDSPLAHTRVANSPLFGNVAVTILGVMRKGEPMLVPFGNLRIHAGDRLIIQGDIEQLHETLDKHGLEFHEQIKDETEEEGENGERKARREKKEKDEVDFGFHEVLVTARSPLNNRTPKEVSLRARYRMSLVAINRQGATLRSKLSEVRIAAGDILVVQFLNNMDNSVLDTLGLVPLQEIKGERRKTHLAPHAVGVFFLSLLLGSITHFPLAITCLAGCVLLVILDILRPAEMYESIEWKVLIFIGAVLCLGKGMQASGTAELLGGALSTFFLTLPDPAYAIAFFFVITVVMTQLLSNQATAVVMIPIAVTTARHIGLEPMAFVMSVTIAASCCFVTPFEPAFMLVYGPGRYRFVDFFRLGIGITILAVIIAVYIIPRAYLL